MTTTSSKTSGKSNQNDVGAANQIKSDKDMKNEMTAASSEGNEAEGMEETTPGAHVESDSVLGTDTVTTPFMGASDEAGQEDGAPNQVVAPEDEESIPIVVETEDGEDTDNDIVATLTKELAEAKAKAAESYDRLVRTTADLENVRRRSRRDVADARTDAKSKVLRDVLPVLDNLDRAMAHANSQKAEDGDSATNEEAGQQANADGIAEGVRLVLRQFEQILQRSEVTPVKALGEAFDPNMHEAVGQLESADHTPGTVLEELQKGYSIGDRLLRPAMVVVSKAAAGGQTPDAEDAAKAENDAVDPDATVPSADLPNHRAKTESAGSKKDKASEEKE